MAEATQEMIAVMQDDREAAAELVAWHNKAASDWKTDGGNDLTFFAADMPESIRRGVWDSHDVVQAFARHRLTAQSGEGRSGAGEDAALKLVAGYVDYTTESKDRWEQGKAAGYRELGSIVAAALNARQSGEGEREQ